MHFIWYHNARHRVVYTIYLINYVLQWRHNERNGVSNRRRLDCLLNGFCGRRTMKTSKPRVTGLYEGNPPVTGGFRHKGPVTRKMFPFDDVIMMVTVLLCFILLGSQYKTIGVTFSPILVRVASVALGSIESDSVKCILKNSDLEYNDLVIVK